MAQGSDPSADGDGYALHIATSYSSRLNNELIEPASSTFLFGESHSVVNAASRSILTLRQGFSVFSPGQPYIV